MQGAQKLRSEAHLRVRRNDEVAAQRRRWTFYETINYAFEKATRGQRKKTLIYDCGHIKIMTDPHF